MKTTKTRRYLTGDGWTDTVVGFFIGLILYGLVFFGLLNGIIWHLLHYLLPHRTDFFSSVVADSVITLLVALLVWGRMRLHYYLPLVNSIFFGGLFLPGFFLYAFQPV